MRRRSILIPLLALGTIGGYGAGFASMACHSHDRRAAFERHVAQVCVEAARRDARRDDARRDDDRRDRFDRDNRDDRFGE